MRILPKEKTGPRRPTVKLKPRWFGANRFWGLGRRVLGERFPAVKLSIGESEIVGVQMKVNSHHEGGKHGDEQIFRNGDKVLEIHVNSTSPMETAKLMRELIETLPKLRESGYAGIYGYTPTHELASAFVRGAGHLGAKEVEVSEEEKKLAKIYYKKRIKKHNFPETHLENEVKGVAIKFDGEFEQGLKANIK